MSGISRSNKKIIKKYVLVTGGSGDIGFEVCKKLSKIGYNVIMCYSKSLYNKDIIKNNDYIIPLKINLESIRSINIGFKLLQKIIKKDTIFENLILCASSTPIIAPLLKSEGKDLLKHFKVGVIGHHYLTKKIINLYFKKNRKGKILTILSKGIKNQTKPSKYMGPYLISKFALEKMIQIIKLENPWIKIKNFYPSFTKTKMLQSFDKDYIKIISKNEKIFSAKEISNLIIRKFLK